MSEEKNIKQHTGDNTQKDSPRAQTTPQENRGPRRRMPRRIATKKDSRSGGDEEGRGNRKGGKFAARVKSEFDHKIINIRRVTRVVAGGRRFSFSVAVVAGDRKGRVGVGIGKAGDTALAIEKALKSARKNMVKLKTTKEMSIPHEVSGKFCSSEVLIMPAPGRGIAAGSSVRNVLELAGITDVSAKVLSRSKNKLNNARVAVKALMHLK